MEVSLERMISISKALKDNNLPDRTINHMVFWLFLPDTGKEISDSARDTIIGIIKESKKKGTNVCKYLISEYIIIKGSIIGSANARLILSIHHDAGNFDDMASMYYASDESVRNAILEYSGYTLDETFTVVQ